MNRDPVRKMVACRKLEGRSLEAGTKPSKKELMCPRSKERMTYGNQRRGSGGQRVRASPRLWCTAVCVFWKRGSHHGALRVEGRDLRLCLVK